MEGGSSASSMPRSISIDGFRVPITTKRPANPQTTQDVVRPLPRVARVTHVSDNRVIPYNYHAPAEEHLAASVVAQAVSSQPVSQSVHLGLPKENTVMNTASRVNYLLVCNVLIFAGITLILATWGLELKSWFLLVYVAIVIALRAPSTVVFGCAFFALTMVPITEIMNKTLLSESYAVYSFLLLTLGTFIAIFELKKEEPTKGFKW